MRWNRWSLIGLAVVAAMSLSGVGRAAASDAAGGILEATNCEGGLVVHLGCGDGKLTAALRADERFLVHGLDATVENVEAARRHVRAQSLYGPVSIDRLAGPQLPYVDNLVNLIVADEPTGVTTAEMLRVLCPGGTAYVRTGDGWRKTVKPRPDEIDRWTHYMHDAGGNAVAHDAVVGPPQGMQWIGSPRWSRHHDHMASTSAMVSTGDRLFSILDEGSRVSIQLPPRWTVVARDAFNGTLLWKRPIARWHTHLWPLKSGPAHLPRRLVAIDDRVYVTLGIDAPVSVLDAATGETVRVLEGTEGAEELIVVGDVLLAVVDDNPVKRYQPAEPYPTVNDIKRDAGSRPWSERPTSVVAVSTETGRVLWRVASRVVPLTLAADAERAYFHDGEKVVCVGQSGGKQLWTSKPIPRWSAIKSFFAPTLLVHDGVVLFSGGEKMVPHRGGQDTMTALAADTGKPLWTAEHGPSGYQSPEDMLVAGGLVWTGATTSGGYSGVFTGRDLHSGQIKSEFAPDVETYWFHHRCYRSKATDKYLLVSRTGIEFLDLATQSWMIHHWTRGGCLYGVMPCNGMVYTPPHNCACYPEAKQFGFNALASASALPATIDETSRRQRGPAFERPAAAGNAATDWPTYRGDNARSGRTTTAVPTKLTSAWQTELGGRLSAPVIAGGRVLLAKIESHQVCSLDAVTGKPAWSFTAGGRVDSPPTVVDGRVVFGSADGHVYCLRADDGALVWRFRAAPVDRRHGAFEQLESVWPVHGSVLVRDGVVHCVAGRSMFLDGGLRMLQIDLVSGQKLAENVLGRDDPATGGSLQDHVQVLNMPVALPDILSCDDRHIAMRSQVFDLEGNRLDLGPHSGDPAGQGSVQRGQQAHLFSPIGFLDGSWFHRSYWVFGRSFAGGHAGYYQAGKYAPSGRILVFDDERVYGFGRKPQYLRWTTPLEHQLFAAPKEAPEAPPGVGRRGGAMVRIEKTESQNPAGKAVVAEAYVKVEKGEGVVLARGGPAHGYALVIRGGRPRFAVRISETLHSIGAPKKILGRWVHLAGVLSADKKLSLYVDGKLAATGQASGLIADDPAQPMEIGADDAGGVGDYQSPFGMTGLVDEVRIFHGPVTPEEIARHAVAPDEATAAHAELVLAYSFADGKARDLSSFGNHGQASGVQAVEGRFGTALRFTGPRPLGGWSAVARDWTTDLPLMVRAMVLAERTLFIAGPPDLVDEEQAATSRLDPETQKKLAEQDAALAGLRGGLLQAISVDDGTCAAEYALKSPPVWDGMASAAGRLYLATKDGKVVCYATP